MADFSLVVLERLISFLKLSCFSCRFYSELVDSFRNHSNDGVDSADILPNTPSLAVEIAKDFSERPLRKRSSKPHLLYRCHRRHKNQLPELRPALRRANEIRGGRVGGRAPKSRLDGVFPGIEPGGWALVLSGHSEIGAFTRKDIRHWSISWSIENKPLVLMMISAVSFDVFLLAVVKSSVRQTNGNVLFY